MGPSQHPRFWNTEDVVQDMTLFPHNSFFPSKIFPDSAGLGSEAGRGAWKGGAGIGSWKWGAGNEEILRYISCFFRRRKWRTAHCCDRFQLRSSRELFEKVWYCWGVLEFVSSIFYIFHLNDNIWFFLFFLAWIKILFSQLSWTC